MMNNIHNFNPISNFINNALPPLFFFTGGSVVVLVIVIPIAITIICAIGLNYLYRSYYKKERDIFVPGKVVTTPVLPIEKPIKTTETKDKNNKVDIETFHKEDLIPRLVSDLKPNITRYLEVKIEEAQLVPDIQTFSNMISSKLKNPLPGIIPDLTPVVLSYLQIKIDECVKIYTARIQKLDNEIKEEDALQISKILYEKLGNRLVEEQDNLKFICHTLIYVKSTYLLDLCLTQAKKIRGDDALTWLESFAKMNHLFYLQLALQVKEIKISTSVMSRSKGEATIVLTENNYKKLNEFIESSEKNDDHPLTLCFDSGDINTLIKFIEKGFIKTFTMGTRPQTLGEMMEGKQNTAGAALEEPKINPNYCRIEESKRYGVLSVEAMKGLAKAIQADTCALVDLTICPCSYEGLLKSQLMNALEKSTVALLDFYPPDKLTPDFLKKLNSLLTKNSKIKIIFSKGICIDSDDKPLLTTIQKKYNFRINFGIHKQTAILNTK